MIDAPPGEPAAAARGARRGLGFLAGLVLVALTAWLGGRLTWDLTVVLLVVLVEVLVIAMLSGPVLAVVAALCAVVVVNWFDVPPYHTFRIDSADNVVSLLVFTVVAVVAAVLVDLSGRARANAARSQEKATLLAEVVSLQSDADSTTALSRIKDALELDRVELRQTTGRVTSDDDPGDRELLTAVGQRSVPPEPPSLEVSLAGGYRLVGYGPARVGTERAFLTSLGEAAVRAYEGERLDQARREAEELVVIDRTRTALLASVGHDLRTPLAGLRIAVEALEGGSGLTDDDRRELVETIRLSTARLDELITDLLDLSRLEAGTVIAHMEATSLDEVVARALLGVGNQGVVSEVSDALPLVATDPALLERIVANLVLNALRHSGASQPVRVCAERSSESVHLRVVDHGVGLPLSGDGTPQWPVPGSARSDGGSGLGLGIVRGFGAALGTPVTLSQTDGGGLTATISLPLWATDAP